MDRRGLSNAAYHKRRQVDVVLAIEGAVNCVVYFSESVRGRHIYKVICLASVSLWHCANPKMFMIDTIQYNN